MAAGVPRFELQRPEGSTGDVDYWTSTDVRETKKSHVNYVIADTIKWEQQAGYYIEKHIFASMSPWSRQQKLAQQTMQGIASNRSRSDLALARSSGVLQNRPALLALAARSSTAEQ